MPDLSEISVVHAIPGRLRLKIASLKHNALLAEDLEKRLAAVDGVEEVRSNLLTGSLLLMFAEKSVAWATVANAVAKPLAALFPPAKPKALAESLLASVKACQAGRPASEGIAESFARMNTIMEGLTGGTIDLRTLLPLGLFYLGMRSLLTTNKLPLPSWYDYLWFALSTFIMLNRRLVDPKT